MTPNRKLAYNYLLYQAMLEIRHLEWWTSAWPRWQYINPRFWANQYRRIRYCGALANALHNLAMFSSYDYDHFEEETFWRGMESLKKRFPTLADNYLHRFECRLNELESGTSPQHSWLPASTENSDVLLTDAQRNAALDEAT